MSIRKQGDKKAVNKLRLPDNARTQLFRQCNKTTL
jgi:hypothetical protein